MATVLTPTAPPAALNGNLYRFGLLLRTNARLFVRNRTALFWSVAFPIGLVLLFGTIFGNQPGLDSKVYIAYLTSGMIVVSLLANGLIGNASTMAVWRERGILQRIQATPLPLWQFLLARIVTQSAIMVIQAFILIATSIVAFGASYTVGNVISAVPAVVAGALLFMALGQAVAALVRKADTVAIVTQVIYFPLLFLGGLMIPVSQLPAPLQTVGAYLPSALIADLIRAPLIGTHLSGIAMTTLPLTTDLLGAIVYFVAAIVVATRFFKWR